MLHGNWTEQEKHLVGLTSEKKCRGNIGPSTQTPAKEIWVVPMTTRDSQSADPRPDRCSELFGRAFRRIHAL